MAETQFTLFAVAPVEAKGRPWFSYRDGCQYAPDRQGIAYTVEVHAGAEFAVMFPDDRFWPWSELRLCGECAERPEFAGLEKERI